jgi:hypothetical protein
LSLSLFAIQSSHISLRDTTTMSTPTSSSARPAHNAAQANTAADKKEAQQDKAKEARFEQHWAQWSSIADRDRSYPVVLPSDANSAPATLIAKLSGSGGAAPKLHTVKRVPGLLENVDLRKDMGTVNVALVDAGVFAELDDQFSMQRITVLLGSGEKAYERTAFIPQPQGQRSATASSSLGAALASQASVAANGPSNGTAQAQKGGNAGVAVKGKGPQQS